MDLNNASPALAIAFAGLTLSGILLGLAFWIKLTNGKFWSLPFSLFMSDSDEREIGNKLKEWIFSNVPAFFVIFLILFLYLMLK